MGVTARSTQVVDVEIVGITTRVERTGTQIDGIGTGGKRRLERLAISRGGEQFRLSHRLVRHRMRIGREALACVLELDPDCLVASRAIGRASLDDLVDVNRLERIRGEVPVGFGKLFGAQVLQGPPLLLALEHEPAPRWHAPRGTAHHIRRDNQPGRWRP